MGEMCGIPMRESAFAVFEQSPRATAKERGERFERRGVDALQVSLLDEAVGQRECQTRPLGELIGIGNAPAFHVRSQVPSYRHGLTVAYKSPVDNTNASVRFSLVPQRERVMADDLVEYSIIVRGDTEYEVRLNETGGILCELCDGVTENVEGVCDRCLPGACAALARAIDRCLGAEVREVKCADVSCVLYGLDHSGRPCKRAVWATKELRNG